MEIQRLIIRIWCQIWPEFKCLTWLFCWVFLLPYMYLGKKLKSAYTCPYKIDWPSAWGRWWVSTDNKRSMPKVCVYNYRSDQISRSVVSDSLQPHESQHARPPCPSPTSGVHSNPRSSSQWCHPAISSSVVPVSSCPQSLPASASFPMSQLFAWCGQSTGVSALASFLPKKS